ncbi:MAG: Crp/Fnr family transcriptional regulator [Cyanobacteria bacterium P01_A01_bin.83]
MSTSISKAKTLFFNSGDKLPQREDYLWRVVSGVVKSYTISEEGTSLTLGFWGANDLVGETLSNVTPYTLKCISNVRAIAIHRHQWSELSENLLSHAQQTQQLLFIVRNNRIAKRLWLLLKWLASKFGRRIPEGNLIDFELTHQELAQAINTTRITVTKTLNQFEREGLIIRPRSKCIIVKHS